MSDVRARRRAVDRAERRRVGRPDARVVAQGHIGDRPLPRGSSPSATRPVFGAEPRELSLLFVLFYIAASRQREQPRGRSSATSTPRDGAQMWRFQRRHAADRRSWWPRRSASACILNSPCAGSTQTERGVSVSPTGSPCAPSARSSPIPPTLAGRIDYHPALPAARDQLTQRLAPGHADQGHRRLRHAVLARRRACPAPSTSADGLVNATFDDSPESGKPGVLLRLRRRRQRPRLRELSPAARQGRGAERARHAVRRPRRAARRPTTTRAGPTSARRAAARSAIAGPGTLLAYGHALRAPSGACTGPERRRRRTGTATWTARCARASGPRPRRSPSSRACSSRGAERAVRSGRPRTSCADSGVMPVRCAT